jgi:uncharacterized protein (DUF3084 family)
MQTDLEVNRREKTPLNKPVLELVPKQVQHKGQRVVAKITEWNKSILEGIEQIKMFFEGARKYQRFALCEFTDINLLFAE